MSVAPTPNPPASAPSPGVGEGLFGGGYDFRKRENDMFAAWNELAKQLGPVASRRLNRATFYRARLKKAVQL